MAPSASSLMPYGFESWIGTVISLMSPVSGFKRPTMLEFCSVKNAVPFLSKIVVCGPFHFAGVPGSALGLERDGVRLRHRRQRIFLHFAGNGIEPPDQIAKLSCPPDRAIRRLDRVTRSLTERRHHP